jgi:hypothetical protein
MPEHLLAFLGNPCLWARSADLGGCQPTPAAACAVCTGDPTIGGGYHRCSKIRRFSYCVERGPTLPEVPKTAFDRRCWQHWIW